MRYNSGGDECRASLTLTSGGAVVLPVCYLTGVIHRTLAGQQKTLLSGVVHAVPVESAARTAALTRRLALGNVDGAWLQSAAVVSGSVIGYPKAA